MSVPSMHVVLLSGSCLAHALAQNFLSTISGDGLVQSWMSSASCRLQSEPVQHPAIASGDEHAPATRPMPFRPIRNDLPYRARSQVQSAAHIYQTELLICSGFP